ncbi:MAG: amidohydrolase family protein [Acidimicrobiia bacterium]|nr:MAG: amidohydrolase family protein [Acidimicrobiia bacterium]
MNLALTNGALYDGVSASLQPATTVLVNGDRIAEIGPTATLPVPPDAEVIDVGGRTILPGLIDLHSHCTFQFHFENSVTRSYGSPRSDAFLALAAVPRLAEALLAGQTTMRDCGSIGQIIYDLRDAIESGIIEGPRLHVAGQIIQPTGGPHSQEPRVVVEADGEPAIRAAVRNQLKRGADFVKLAIDASEWTRQELEAAVDEAHRRGRKVACHVVLRSATKMAIAAGVDTLEHARFLDDEDALAMRDKGIALVPAVSGIRDKVALGEAFLQHDLLSPALRRDVETTLEFSRPRVEEQASIIERALDADVTIGAGTDRTGPYGKDPFADIVRELEVMVGLGVPTDRALKSATSTAAEIMGIEADVGVISPGRVADLIVIDGNPLSDIGTLRDVALVLKGGVAVASHATLADGAAAERSAN